MTKSSGGAGRSGRGIALPKGSIAAQTISLVRSSRSGLTADQISDKIPQMGSTTLNILVKRGELRLVNGRYR